MKLGLQALRSPRWNSDKLRAWAAIRLIGLGRWLLKLPPAASGDFDTCIYCKASGCETGTAGHKPDCPRVTGVYPVRLQEMWPAGPATCERCGTTLWPGDSYGHVAISDGHIPVVEIACTGCALLAEVEASA
jgi:hypothetical protein